MRSIRQRGPNFSITGTKLFDATQINPIMVKIHPMPMPWIPGSILTVATAPNEQRTKLFVAVIVELFPGNKSTIKVWKILYMAVLANPTINCNINITGNGTRRKSIQPYSKVIIWIKPALIHMVLRRALKMGKSVGNLLRVALSKPDCFATTAKSWSSIFFSTKDPRIQPTPWDKKQRPICISDRL